MSPDHKLSPVEQGSVALHRGVFEIEFLAATNSSEPYFGKQPQIIFTRPDESEVVVDSFYDGQNRFKARAYCSMLGDWLWRSQSPASELEGQAGAFTVVPSSLKGKLKKHSDDPRQFAYDDGDWFLHIGDTGYRYVTASEPKWREYIDQAEKMGATKIRTWFCQERGDVQILFTDDRQTLNLGYWQEIDRRIRYALEEHPHVILKLIPYGEDTAELNRYAAGDPLAHLIAQYAQARFSAYPNVMWCVSNDREIVADPKQDLKGRQVHAETIRRIAQDMAAREPWGTLLTNHQSRWKGYSFVDEPWSDVITLEDMDQVDGQILLEYRQRGNAPVVNDEDRYEHHRNPEHDRYFFRRLMWGSLLSGGHATYGGLRTYEPYDGDLRGVQGYADAVRDGKLEDGGHDFVHIHRFFADAELTLVNMVPDDSLVGNDPLRWKCIHNTETYIVYLANPTGTEPGSDDVADTTPSVSVQLPSRSFSVRWFCPRTGDWHEADSADGGKQTFLALAFSVVSI